MLFIAHFKRMLLLPGQMAWNVHPDSSEQELIEFQQELNDFPLGNTLDLNRTSLNSLINCQEHSNWKCLISGSACVVHCTFQVICVVSLETQLK